MSNLDLLAAPAVVRVLVAAGGYTIGSGRTVPTVAAVLGLISVVIGGLALARSAGRIGAGNGRAGAIVALVLGLVGMVLGGLALARSRRLEPDSHPGGSGPQKLDGQQGEKKVESGR